jgi:hypothetical protein
MGNIREYVALLVMGSLAAGLIVRLPQTTAFAHSMLQDFNSLSRTLSGQLGAGSLSK